jgi:hypothetical protein
MQAGLALCDFFLSDFALIRLENSQHFSNLRNIFRFNHFGIDYFWPRLSSVGVLRKVTSLSRRHVCGLITVVIQSRGSFSFLFNSIGFSYQHE